MKNFVLIIFIGLGLNGCASVPATTEIRNDQPLIQIPAGPVTLENDNVSFQDISLSSQRRLQVLTNQMEIEKETDNYVDKGQADTITQPDGTILYPYGLAEAKLMTKRMMYSKIVLQQGEKIMSAQAGDTTRWNILPTYIGDVNSYTPVVLVKPLLGGLLTSLSIITNRRDYDISIQSQDHGDYMPRIGFYYPQDKADAIKVGSPPGVVDGSTNQPKINIENIKYDYRVKGDARLSWYPKSIFEDGNKVFIRMPEGVDHSQLPVFMTIDQGGETEVANYRYFKPYFVVDNIFNQGVLILGTDRYRQIIKLVRI